MNQFHFIQKILLSPQSLQYAFHGHLIIPLGMMNYRFLTTETNLKALYIFRCLFTTLSVKLFVVTVQIFVYKSLFTIVFFGKRKNSTHETFHILKMKAHFENEPHFGNESSLQNPLSILRNVFSFSKYESFREYFFSFSEKHNCKQKFVNKNLYSHYK